MVNVRRTENFIRPDSSRVLFRPLEIPRTERVSRIIARLLYLSDDEARAVAGQVTAEFHGRHDQFRDYLMRRYEQIRPFVPTDRELPEERRTIIGAAFTQEYALEAAALFNPSIVPHPDQSDVPAGALRFVMSLRAVGEGHISSIVFRQGIIDADGTVEMTPPSSFVVAADINPNPRYEKTLFLRKLSELGLLTIDAVAMMDRLGEGFTFAELDEAIRAVVRRDRTMSAERQHALDGVRALARSNYGMHFPPSRRMSERVIFPTSPMERAGIEDARFVAFTDDDGVVTYYATYTAYDGSVILPQLLETRDFENFQVSTLNGPVVENKGMALFPHKINGHYAMLSRQDNESLYLMYSDMLHFWYTKQLILRPSFPWECVQIGNCGSPVKTDQGWLVITHGVGPMRKYSLGAALLDLEDPSVVIGRLPEPLMSVTEDEREGYVPNVLYTCGALVHGENLVLPYAMSDQASSFAVISLDELVEELLRQGPFGTGPGASGRGSTPVAWPSS